MSLPDFITAASLRELAAAGTVSAVQLVPQGGGFVFVVKIGMIERVLRPADDSKRPRLFKTIDAGAKFARGLGLARIQVELANWQPKQRAIA